MPCPHFRIKISARSKSPPTTAQAAYQSGERLYDERTRRVKDHKSKEGVLYTEVMLPDNAPPEYADRNTLWNSVERFETAWNAQLARKLHIALPRELSREDNLRLIREYCLEQFVSKGMVADIAFHDPDPPNHNPHAHVMLTMRAIDGQGRWMPKSRREYLLDEEGNRVKGPDGKWKFRKVFTTDWDDRGNAEKWRQAWEDMQNRFLEEAGRPERVSLKSYERQGTDQIPTVHIGPAVTAMERRGIETDIGNLNREIKKVNALVAAIKSAIARIKDWIAELDAAVHEIEFDPKEVMLIDLLNQRFAERKAERMTWTSVTGERKAGVKDLQRFIDITTYMRENGIFSVADLEDRIAGVSAAEQPARDKIKEASSRIRTIEGLLEAGERKAGLDPVHDQYLKIHWKGRRERFADEHKADLAAWNKADRFIRKFLPDQPFNAKALQSELSSLNARLDELNNGLGPYQEEMKMLKDIRYFVKDLIPELEPEGDKLTPEKKEQKQMTMRERLAAAKAEAERQNAERQQKASPTKTGNERKEL